MKGLARGGTVQPGSKPQPTPQPTAQQQRAFTRQCRRVGNAPNPRAVHVVAVQASKESGAAAAAAPPPGKQEWLAKALAAAGVASRRACIELVKQGRVSVNGAVVDNPATKVDMAAVELSVNGVRVTGGASSSSSSSSSAGGRRLQLPGLHYFAVHKPPGYICSNVSSQPGKRAVDLLQPWLDAWAARHKGLLPPRLFTVGRLDVQTSGLLLVTNDGDWAQKVIHPSADITKEYWATVRGSPTPQQLQQLRAGTDIDGVRVVPKHVGLVGQRQPPQQQQQGRTVVRLEVAEGKKHEVRLLVAGAGLQLLQLSRQRIGGLLLPRGLEPGQYMELPPQLRERVLQPPPPRDGAGSSSSRSSGAGRGGGGRRGGRSSSSNSSSSSSASVSSSRGGRGGGRGRAGSRRPPAGAGPPS